MRRFAISDIHGCAKTFKKLLQRINFSQEDTLYLLGDYIDRGPDSRGVIDHIFDLQENGFKVHCLRGNHEQFFIDAFEETESHYQLPEETLKSFDANAVRDIPSRYIDWMKSLPYYFQLDKYLLVHAGLNFKVKNPLEDEQAMIWIRYWYKELDDEWLGDKIIVHGHTPIQQLDIKKSIHRLDHISVINIDAGCVFESFGFGHLCALNLDSQQLIFEKDIDTVIEVPPQSSKSKTKESTIIEGLIINPTPETKILYFDIDGTLLDYDDQPKTALLNGKLQAFLKKAKFDYLACVSGWVDIFEDKVMKLHSLEQRKTAMYQLLEPLFPDKDWFMERLILVSDTDARCSYIRLQADWFYVDDWADKFFTEANGAEKYEEHLDARILLCDHKGDGQDLLDWLDANAIKDQV